MVSVMRLLLQRRPVPGPGGRGVGLAWGGSNAPPEQERTGKDGSPMRLLAVALTAVLIVVSVAAIVGGFALLARRLLGLRFGLVRLLLAGLVGFAVAGPIAQALAGSIQGGGGTATPLWFLILAGAAALVVAMVFLVVAEALVPSGSMPGPLELRRALRGRAARARRYSQITRIAVRHGLGPYLW